MKNKPCTVTFFPSKEGKIRYFVNGAEAFTSDVDNVFSTDHCVTMGNNDAKAMLTEHLSAALAFCEIDSIDICMTETEVPALDGSSKQWVELFKKAGIVIGTLLALLLFFMTISRFGDKAGLYFYKYAGEAMINFNGILFNHVHGTTDGMAYFWYIPQLLGFGDASFADLSDKWDFINSKTGVTGMIFYTAVGAFIIEFGKFKTLLLVGGLSWLMCRIFSQRLSARILIVLCWCAYQLISSVYLLPIQGDGGIISLFGVILFYYVFSPKFKQRTIKNLKL